MYRLPSLPAVLYEREIIHLATAQHLAEWQRRAEQDACPEASRQLDAIVGYLRVLPRNTTQRLVIDRLVDELVTDIRQRVISDLRHPIAQQRLQTYAERLARLAVPAPVADVSA